MLEINQIHNIDCIEGLKQLPDKCVDCIITDPPYNLNKEGIVNDDSLWGYELEYYRVLKDNSWLCIYCSIGQVSNVIKLIEKQSFKYEWQHITYIDNGMVRGRIGFNNFMLCLIFSKGEAKLRNITKDVYKCSTSSKQRNSIKHPTPKKVKAIHQLVKGFSNEGDLILDPFMGSGTTALACKQNYRNFIGFEIDSNYVETAQKRLSQKLLFPLAQTNEGGNGIPPINKLVGILPKIL